MAQQATRRLNAELRAGASTTHDMPTISSNEASKPNPALAPLAALVGDWDTVGSHPMIPGTLHGRATFAWMEGGAFLIMRTTVDQPQVPSGLAIFGSDDETGALYMLYFDERGVSRKYDVKWDAGALRWWRDAPGFSQRYVTTIAGDGRTMASRGELCRDGATWEQDLVLAYTRVA